MIDYKEKRHFPRVKAGCAMSFKRVAQGNQARAVCMDISASGLMFETDEPIEIGRALEIRTFPNDRVTPPIIALVEVIRCVMTEQGRYRVAGVIKGIKSQTPEHLAV
jgi:hypothetical protein